MGARVVSRARVAYARVTQHTIRIYSL